MAIARAAGSAVFTLRTESELSCDGARAVLADFLRVSGPRLLASLPGAAVAVED